MKQPKTHCKDARSKWRVTLCGTGAGKKRGEVSMFCADNGHNQSGLQAVFAADGKAMTGSAVVDGGCLFVLGIMDLAFDAFVIAGSVVNLFARRLHHFLFRAPSKLSEWNLAWATIALGAICALGESPVGGRDVFIEAGQLVVGGLRDVPRMSITHPSADEIALALYGCMLIFAGVALLLGIYLTRTSPGVRRDALFCLQVLWVWSAGIICPFHPWTVTGTFVAILALTSIALHRRALAEGRRRDERQQDS